MLSRFFILYSSFKRIDCYIFIIHFIFALPYNRYWLSLAVLGKRMSSRYLFLLFFVVLSGCTSLSQEDCVRANWEELGYSHGEQGYTFEQGRHIVSACTQFGITAQLDDYQVGYKQGLAAFCQPENGFTLGLRGDAYNGVCNDTQFRKAWQEGNERYQLEARKTEIDNRLRNIDWRLQSINNELASNKASSNQSKELRREREQLEKERSNLRKEKALLPILNKLPSWHFKYEL